MLLFTRMRVSTSIIFSFFILRYVTSVKPYFHQQINGNVKRFVIAIQFFELLPKIIIVLKIILMIIEKF